MDGITALEKIIQFDANAKVIMVSALGKQDLVKDALIKGAKNYIVKPLDREKVLERVVSSLKQSLDPIAERNGPSRLNSPLNSPLPRNYPWLSSRRLSTTSVSNSHPAGCAADVARQITYVKSRGFPYRRAQERAGRRLVDGLRFAATRIAAAFGGGAKTIGVAFEKERQRGRGTGTLASTTPSPSSTRPPRPPVCSASRISTPHAFSGETKDKGRRRRETAPRQLSTCWCIRWPVPCAPILRTACCTARGAQAPLEHDFVAKSIDPFKGEVKVQTVTPATAEEAAATVKVMGGEDWELWVDALETAGVLAKGFTTVAYSYIGPQVTYPFYRSGTIGKAKEHLEATAHSLSSRLAKAVSGGAYVSINKALVTRASAVIPAVSLYISLLYKVMKKAQAPPRGLHRTDRRRLFRTRLYAGGAVPVDKDGLIRIDDWEMEPEIQGAITDLWDQVNGENLKELCDVKGFEEDFLQLNGFGYSRRRLRSRDRPDHPRTRGVRPPWSTSSSSPSSSLLNGFFAMSEIAIVSSRKSRLKQKADEGHKSYARALETAQHPGPLLSTMQVGITLIGIFSGALGEATLSEGFQAAFLSWKVPPDVAAPLSFGTVVVCIALASVFLGELVPKRIALSAPERIAAAVVSPLKFFSILFYPFERFLTWASDGVLSLLGVKPNADPPVTEEELKVLLREGRDAGVFHEVEQNLAETMLTLDDKGTHGYLTQRIDLLYLERDEEIDIIRASVIDHPEVDAFPVCEGGLDNVVGVVDGRRILAALADGEFPGAGKPHRTAGHRSVDRQPAQGARRFQGTQRQNGAGRRRVRRHPGRHHADEHP